MSYIHEKIFEGFTPLIELYRHTLLPITCTINGIGFSLRGRLEHGVKVTDLSVYTLESTSNKAYDSSYTGEITDDMYKRIVEEIKYYVTDYTEEEVFDAGIAHRSSEEMARKLVFPEDRAKEGEEEEEDGDA